MNRHERRRALSIRKRNATTAAETGHASKPNRALGYQFNTASPRVLLLGTALASTFLLASIAAPSTAQAQAATPAPECAANSPVPIDVFSNTAPIICVNTEPRTRDAGPYDAAIGLATTGDDNYVDLTNSGPLTTDPVTGLRSLGISTYTGGQRSTITVTNSGEVHARTDSDGEYAIGIYGLTEFGESSITVTSEESITAQAYGASVYSNGYTYYSSAFGIYERTNGSDSSITINNRGTITSTSANGDAYGIFGFSFGAFDRGQAYTYNGNVYRPFAYADRSPITITNTGEIEVTSGGGNAEGISAFTYGLESPIVIDNSANIAVTSTSQASNLTKGLKADSDAAYSPVTVVNRGRIDAISEAGSAYGIAALSHSWEFEAVPYVQSGYVYFAYYYNRVGHSPITITNSNAINAYAGTNAHGIFGRSYGPQSSITITNSGAITADAGEYAYGIFGHSSGEGSSITIDNSGVIIAYGGHDAVGILGRSDSSQSSITIDNSGMITASAGVYAFGIDGRSYESQGSITIDNSGMIIADAGNDAAGIFGRSFASQSSITIDNSGAIDADAGLDGYGILGRSRGAESSITITNSGAIIADGVINAYGIFGRSYESQSSIAITNSGAIDADAGDNAFGIFGRSSGAESSIAITNSGAVTANAEVYAYGIFGRSSGPQSSIVIDNSGAITANSEVFALGIFAFSHEPQSSITINNGGAITVRSVGTRNVNTGQSPGGFASGMYTNSYGVGSPIAITNSGPITVTVDNEDGSAFGIVARTHESGSLVAITNNGDIAVRTNGIFFDRVTYSNSAIGIIGRSFGKSSPIDIVNTASVYAEGKYSIGIGSDSAYANRTTIVNTGSVGASSHLAINVRGAGTAHITNAGTITGYVDLTDQDDRFENRSGGVFETKQTSLFRGGNDLFLNRTGATVLGASDGSSRESSGFQGLETFRNSGTISLVDGGVGDIFTLANTPGEADLDFEGGGFVAVDANLAGPGSQGDSFIVDGNVSGVTRVVVNNASSLPGVLNTEGIPIIYVEGATPSENNFVLADGPVSAGLFDYDLFFVPTGSGVWELRSFVSGAAYALPKLLTAAQDLWHQSSATWFDRTADLRVILQGGEAPAYHDATRSLGEPGQERLRSDGLTPAVWMKGGGSRLDRDGSATTSAYGRTYNYDLDNEFSSFDLQVGVDMGQYDVISQGDVVIFGVLGGFVGGKLDYDSLADTFDFS
ncbi:MAG: hypothetical protein AAGF09_04505, partial [Pseudomonadota bacterium]